METPGTGRAPRGHRRDLLDALRSGGPSSRAELGRRLGISATTVSKAVASLIEDGLVTVDSPSSRGHRGRPARLVRLATPPGVVAGVDIGRSHARLAVATRDEQVLAERFLAIQPGQDRTRTTTTIVAGLADLLAEQGLGEADLRAVGLGLPGPIDRTSRRVVTGTILPEWVGYDIAGVLRDELGIPVAVDNDANLGVLGEWRHGAARGHSNAAYVKVSSGIGCGFLVNGAIHRGAGGTAGELGHTPIEPDGAVCRCGSRGCLETVASVPALLAMLAPTLGNAIEVDDVLRLAAQNDRACVRAIGDVGRYVGRGLAIMCNLLNPDFVVIGGALVSAGDTFFDAVREATLRNSIPASGAIVHIVPSALRNRAELVGAVALAAQTANDLP